MSHLHKVIFMRQIRNLPVLGGLTSIHVFMRTKVGPNVFGRQECPFSKPPMPILPPLSFAVSIRMESLILSLFGLWLPSSESSSRHWFASAYISLFNFYWWSRNAAAVLLYMYYMYAYAAMCAMLRSRGANSTTIQIY